MSYTLRDFSRVRLGYKSHLNDFFYVDKTTVEAFSIEDDFLEPVFKLDDLDGIAYWQHPTPSRWLFVCELEPADIRGTGAGRYVDWASRQSMTLRKQAKREVITYRDALERQGARHWYWPQARPHMTRLAIRKGIGERYAPFIFAVPTLLDQRLYLLSPSEAIDDELLAAYLASSLFPLAIETNRDVALGAGVLTMGVRSFRNLPTPDLTSIQDSQLETEVRAAARSLLASSTPSASEYEAREDVRALDELMLEAIGISPGRAPELERQVGLLAWSRHEKSRRRATRQKDRASTDITAVAKSIANRLGDWGRRNRFPEDFIADGAADQHLLLPRQPMTLRSEPLLDTCTLTAVTTDDQVAFKMELPFSVAEVVVRAMQFGRADFSYSSNPDEASRALEGLKSSLAEYEQMFDEAIQSARLGSKHAPAVLAAVKRQSGVPLDQLREPLHNGEWIVYTAE